jgi:hypothetical protein
MMRLELMIGAALLALLALPGHACGMGECAPAKPPVVTPQDGDSIVTPHESRAWDICCPLPGGQTLLKVAGNLDALRPLAVLQCSAVVAERATCTERQQGLARK